MLRYPPIAPIVPIARSQAPPLRGAELAQGVCLPCSLPYQSGRWLQGLAPDPHRHFGKRETPRPLAGARSPVWLDGSEVGVVSQEDVTLSWRKRTQVSLRRNNKEGRGTPWFLCERHIQQQVQHIRHRDSDGATTVVKRELRDSMAELCQGGEGRTDLMRPSCIK